MILNGRHAVCREAGSEERLSFGRLGETWCFECRRAGGAYSLHGISRLRSFLDLSQDASERSIKDLELKTAAIISQASEEEPPATSPHMRQSCPQLFMTCASSPLQEASTSPSSPGFESVLQDVAEVVNVSPA